MGGEGEVEHVDGVAKMKVVEKVVHVSDVPHQHQQGVRPQPEARRLNEPENDDPRLSLG